MRSPVLPLTWHLTRSAGRRGLQSQLLAAGAAAVGAFVMLVIVAATLGAGTRADHTKWRTPDAVSSGRATAVQALATTWVRHDPVTVVSLAQLPGRARTPAPPGLDSFPKQGEVYVSPALADLLHKLPASQLADRFPKVRSYGTIGDAGLASPDELVAVVGRAPTDAALAKSAADDSRSWFDIGQLDRAGISGFRGDTASMFTAGDQGIAALGVVLLALPVTVLSAAAGRLGAARREQRLAALRLAGATPRQIIAMTAAEAAVLGAGGAVTGALAYVLSLPVLAQVPFGVGTWFVGTLWVGLPWLAAVVAGVTVLITVSAVSMLRQVASSPLGVAQQADPRRTRMIRLAFFVAALAVIFLFSGGGMSSKQALALLLLFYGAFWLFGPWVVDRLGRLVSRFAKRPATLLAGRRLSDDPRGAWRTVSGLVLAGFAAGFFSVSMLGSDTSQYQGQVAVSTASAADARSAAVEARTLLRGAGVTATVAAGRTDDYENLLGGNPGVIAHVRGDQVQIDTATTALTPLVAGRFPFGQDYAGGSDKATFDRLDAVTIGTLALSFLLAASSAGLTAAANVLDRRRVYGLLRLAGTPLRVLDRARVRETVIPLVVLAGGTTAMGAYGSYQLNKTAGATINTSGVIELMVCVVIGAVAVFAAISGSRPLLRKVTTDPAQTAE
ncbi:FtsX-like permease family protein [Streptomyces sp. CA-249302]|uniref:FtsX-like permease family protein n=1 Tax=Streptomyces sp. CA-249302 TaxID=3240058 RepID=UPI003D8E95A6